MSGKEEDSKLGDGILSHIVNESNVVTSKPLDLDNPEEVRMFRERFEEICKQDEEKMKDSKLHCDKVLSAQFNGLLLLESSDDDFSELYQSKKLVIMCAEAVMNKIEERAKELGL